MAIPKRVRALLARRMQEQTPGYPWWLPTGVAVVAFSLVVASLAQRGTFDAPALSIAGAVMAAVPTVWVLLAGCPWSAWPVSLLTIAGVAMMLLDPVSFDVAPVLLMLMAASVTAVDGAKAGAAATGASLVLLVIVAWVPGLSDAGLNIVGVLLGFDVGFTMLWQKRALDAERERRQIERTLAADAERQRIAREIHDVVGHSLSVTMLHLTGARRLLECDEDADDALEALREAEQVGRAAMTDIRRTVGLLASGRPETAPQPGIADIGTLVDSIRAAGVQVTCRTEGATPASPAVGLTVYRIVQESLANIAKHAPSQRAVVAIGCGGDQVNVSVTNRLARGMISAPADSGTGRGLKGMSERITQLGGTFCAGTDTSLQQWEVEAVIPLASEHTEARRTPGAERRCIR